MPDNKKITLDEIIQETLAMPEATPLGLMAMAKENKGHNSRVAKSGKTTPLKQAKAAIRKLKSLEKQAYEISDGENSKNPLESNIKEISELAIGHLCLYFRQNTGYNPNWITDIVDEYWQGGRKNKHPVEIRIACGQLIEFCTKHEISQRQAFKLAKTIYDFEPTEAKEVYYEFRKNLKKYYFPEIKIKKHIPIRIMLDIIKYGRFSGVFVISGVLRKERIKFQEIIKGAVNTLSFDMRHVKKHKLDKLGIKPDPIIAKFVNMKFNHPENFISEIRRNPEFIRPFVRETIEFLNSLELYRSVK